MCDSVNSMDRLDGKVAIITGGAQGIGRASAYVLAQHGATVVLADMNIENAEKTASEFVKEGLTAVASEVNIASRESVEKMVRKVREQFDTIDILVNVAGIGDDSTPLTLDEESWNRIVDIDLRGAHFVTQAVLETMINQRSGKIVNIGSSAGQMGGMYIGVAYTAAKGGTIAMTKGYARFCAQYGINVNCIAPGLIQTPLTMGRGDDPNTVPLKRLGTATDCAKAVYFLSSQLSDYITGATIDVNGGILMR